MLSSMLSSLLLPLKLAAGSVKSVGSATLGVARATQQLASAGKQASSQVGLAV